MPNRTLMEASQYCLRWYSSPPKPPLSETGGIDPEGGWVEGNVGIPVANDPATLKADVQTAPVVLISTVHVGGYGPDSHESQKT